MRTTLLVVLAATACCFGPRTGAAQVKGALLRDSVVSTTSDGRREARPLSTVEVAQRNSTARLVLDPSLSSTLRASSAAFGVFTTSSGTEASLQLNLSRDSNSVSMRLVAPTAKQSAFTDLVSLDGLIGVPRAEFNWIGNVAGTKVHMPYLRGVGGASVHEYRMTAGGDETSTREIAFESSAGYGRKIGARLGGLLRVGLKYVRRFADSPSQSVCTQAVGAPAGVFTCEEQMVGAPRLNETQGAEAEFRTSLSWITVGAVVTRDVKNGATGVVIPLWFLRDDKGALGGGVRLGYSSAAPSTWHLSVFVGSLVP
jgi:hypothetical protein